ncbi:MAG TPA: 6-phosphogluconolactonase [Pyrinomonadaceae bacterium]
MIDIQNLSQVLIFDNSQEVARAAAARFVEIARAAINQSGRFSVALSGGSTPKVVYELLASDEYRNSLEWSQVHIFFGDERCVPPDHAESNYRIANEAMLSRLPIPTQNIHRMQGVGDAVANARLYEDESRTFFTGALWPRFDLVLLGMGDDGHTASLFPGSPALSETSAWVAANWVEKFNAFRITLTLPAINHAAHIIFLVTGDGKAQRLSEVLSGENVAGQLPSQLIRPVDGSLEWLIDKAAAAHLDDK